MTKQIKAPKKLNNGFELYLEEDKKSINMKVHGKMTLDESLDLLNTSMYNVIKVYDNRTENKHTDEIYERAVQGFSLMIDRFRPEKNFKHTELTNEAILKAENELLSSTESKNIN